MRPAILALLFAPAMLAGAALGLEAKVGDESVLAEGPSLAAPRAARSGNTYLVVWQQGRMGLGATADIVGMRLEAGSLKPLDKEPIKICAAPEEQSEPTVAAAGDKFLVAWQDFRSGTDFDVRAVLLDASSGKPFGEELELASGKKNQARPAAAGDGEVFLVAWQEAGEPDVYGIFAARVSKDGKRLDEKPLGCSASGASPAACGSGGKFLVTWSTGDGLGAALVDAASGNPGAALGTKGMVNSRCPDAAAIAHDGAGGFMIVSAREGFPNPWGWPGPGCVLVSRVNADGSTPESGLDYGYRLNNVCGRKVRNVVDTATWGNLDTWQAGSPGGFKNTRDGLWPNGWPAVAPDGRGGYVFAWVKGRISPDRLNLANLDIWLRGLDGKSLAATVPDGKASAAEDADETRPVLVAGPKGELLLVYQVLRAGQPRRIAARKVTIGG